jgi:hypothetical protein
MPLTFSKDFKGKISVMRVRRDSNWVRPKESTKNTSHTIWPISCWISLSAIPANNCYYWNKLQGTSQNAVTSLADATTQISNHISYDVESNYHATPALAISDFGIPLTGSMATGFAKSSISILFQMFNSRLIRGKDGGSHTSL